MKYYRPHLAHPVQADLNNLQRTIIEHPESPFHKRPLINKLTDKGSITLTDSSFTQWVDRTAKKENIDEKRFSESRKEYFNL